MPWMSFLIIKRMKNTQTEEKSAELDAKSFWQRQFEEPITDEAFLTQLNSVDLSEIETNLQETNGDKWLKLIKSTFLFLPGAFFLFTLSSFLFYAFFDMKVGLFSLAHGIPWLAMCGFMVMYGMGNIKKPKHLMLPLSIVGLSFAVYLISSLIGDTGGIRFLSYYSMYLFPLVLATPFLIKSIVDEVDEPLGLE